MAASSSRRIMSTNNYNMFFCFRKTVAEMLCDRGYDANAYLVPSFQDFRSLFGWPDNLNLDALGFRVSHLSDPSNTMEVVFPGDGPVTATHLSNIFNYKIMNKESLTNLIIVMFPNCEIEPRAKDSMQDWPFKVEVMDHRVLYSNPVRHDAGWKTYEVLTDEEKAAVVNRYNLEGKELPLTSKTDRVARYYALVEGQVIKVTKVRAEIDDPERVSFLLVS